MDGQDVWLRIENTYVNTGISGCSINAAFYREKEKICLLSYFPQLSILKIMCSVVLQAHQELQKVFSFDTEPQLKSLKKILIA